MAVVLAACWLGACGSSGHGNGASGGAMATGGSAGTATGGASGAKGGSGGAATGGQVSTGGSNGGGVGTGGAEAATGGAGPGTGGAAGKPGGAAGTGGGPPATGGSHAGGAPATGGAGSGGAPQPANILVTSTPGAYWQTGTVSNSTASTVDVTVDDSPLATFQTWEGFGGAFNEIGWNLLTSKAMQDDAIRLLFDATDGANFAWGLIPIGATDYAMSRYTLDDTGPDVSPSSNESNRPPADQALAMFSLERDGKLLIPYVKAALKAKSDLRLWAGPWTPPVWMKTGFKKDSGTGSGLAKVPSYFDGGTMKSDAATLAAYAQYFTKFVQGYRDQGIPIESVAPQNDPSFDQNNPSCLWDKATYTTFIGNYLGPAMKALNVYVMLGMLAKSDTGTGDIELANAVLADPAAMSFVTVVGVEWGALDKVNTGTTFGKLPIWVTTHKFGNYPFCPSAGSSGCPSAYNSVQAPNDQAYGVESWGYVKDAITKGRVTVYHAWNMVLDKIGLGIDTSRDWKQDALLIADGGKVNPTPAYYMFRHVSQYVVPGAKVVTAKGGDALAFKNPDGSLVAVVQNTGAAKPAFVVAMGGKTVQFAMPGNGWATVKLTP